MLIEHLEEFTTLARMTSYPKASAELHLSQSSLTRHIKAMEAELGFALFGTAHNRLFVTKEGNEFLNKVIPLIESYRQTVEECRKASTAGGQELIIQEPPFQDLASVSFLRMFHSFRESNPGVSARYVPLTAELNANLDEGRVDIAFEYRYGGRDAIEQGYADRGYSWAHLCEVGICVMCRQDSELASKDSVSLEDISALPILFMYDDFVPARLAFENMFEHHGIRPKSVNYATSNISEMFMASTPGNSVMLLPEGAEQGIPRYVAMEHELIPLNGERIRFYAIFRPNIDDNEALGRLHAYFESYGDEAAEGVA